MVKPARWTSAPVEMKEGPGQAQAGEAQRYGGFQQGMPVMPGKGDVYGQSLVLARRRAANRCVPKRATMARCNEKRLARLRPQRFQCIQKCRVVPVFTSTEPPATMTGQLANTEVWPAPVQDMAQSV